MLKNYQSVTHMTFRGISRISIDFSYIGQCDLINTCFGLPHEWYTPGRKNVQHISPDFKGIYFHFN